MKAFVLPALAALLLCALFPVDASAETTGSIAGLVVDSTGRPVSGATVTVSSPAQVAHATTDAGGRYAILDLVPGTYSLRVEKSAYWAAVYPNLAVNAGEQTVADAQIHVLLRTVTIDFVHDPVTLVNRTEAADIYHLSRRSNPLFEGARSIGELLPFVPGVLVTGGGAPPQ